MAFLTNPIERAVIKNKDELQQIEERYNEAYAHAAIVVESRPSLSVVHVTRVWLDERIALRESWAVSYRHKVSLLQKLARQFVT